jgi:hypothetical protein
MKKRNFSFLLAAVILPGLTFGLSGCSQLNKDLADLNSKMAGNGGQSGGSVMAVQQDASQNKTKVVIPNDKKVSGAIDEALPTIKKVLAIHQCLKADEGMRLLNTHAVTGVDMRDGHGYIEITPITRMKYHDKNKCVSVQALDQWEMPALNALNFRVVFFSNESGEVSNFKYFFKKTDGTWKIARSEVR